MSFSQTIKGTILPKIPLKTLFEEDNSAGSENFSIRKAPRSKPDNSQLVGAKEPFVKIGGQPVKEVEMLTIDETGFIPTVTLSFVDSYGEFAGDYFPKNNLIMNVYMKSGSEKFKPIRCDFVITSVKSIPAKNTGSRRGVAIGTSYLIKGELYIPNLYQNVSKSYANLNSKETLKKICLELGLGFAENESSPNDTMTWVNINQSYLKFMQTIVEHSYQSDDSFFTAFIDKYYYLNYIEVNEQLKIGEVPLTFVAPGSALSLDYTQAMKDDGVSKALQETVRANYLTTELGYINAMNYMYSVNLISDQGNILRNQGYKKEIYYYDHLKKAGSPKEKFVNFFVAPLRGQDRDRETFLIPEEESLAENRVKKWMNIDYGNTHIHWNASRVINTHNLKELEKIKLRACLNHINFQAVRGFVMPVFITTQQAEQILKATETQEDTVQRVDSGADLKSEKVDLQLSGYYYLSGAKYHYDSTHPNGLYTEFFLARREWQPSKKTA